MNRLAWAVLLACASGACSQSGAPQQKLPPSPSPDGGTDATPVTSTPTDAAAGGETAFRVRAALLSPLRGDSSVDGRLLVYVSCRTSECAVDRSGTAALLATKMRFTNGTDVVGVVSDGPAVAGNVPTTYEVAFRPTAALRADTVYTLEIVSDSMVVAGFMDSTQKEGEASLAAGATPDVQSIRLYTGSVPSPTSVEISNVPSKPLTSIRIRFSEPVLLWSMATELQLVGPAGAPIAGCPWVALSSRCVEANDTTRSSLVDFVFSGAVTKDDLMGAALDVSGALRGDGRTLADGLRAVGKPLDASGRTKIPLTAAAWTSCSSNGDTLCIRDLAGW